MPMTPGYYMPTMYGNAYYPNQMSQTVAPMQQSYTQPPQQLVQNNSQGIIWVDGEVGAKAHQMPAGWPAGVPIPLWDTNDTVIYLKSINQMGMPNPLQKIHYTIEEQNQTQNMLPSGNTSGAAAPSQQSMENYVTKEDLEAMRAEIREMLGKQMSGSQNGNRNGQNNANRGGGQNA